MSIRSATDAGLPDKRTKSEKPKGPRTFHVNGRLTKLDQQNHYYSDVSESNIPAIERIASQRAFLMLHAARGSGKSTRVSQILESLEAKGYLSLYVDLQGAMFDNTTSLQEFWNEFARLISINWQGQLLDINTSAKFQAWLSDPKNFEGQDARVVLAIDEFDKMYEAKQSVIDNFLGCLRSLRQSNNRLWSLIAIGPFSILSLASISCSPFNISDALESPSFTKEQVTNLFHQFTQDRLLPDLDQRIITDIYERTSGHAGLVCYCGKIIQRYVDNAEKERLTEYHPWIAFASKLPLVLTEVHGGWATMSRIVLCMQRPDIRHFVVTHFLRGSQPVKRDMENEKQLNYLAAEGILRPIMENDRSTYVIISPLIRNLLLTKEAAMSKTAFPKGFPASEKDGVNLEELLKTVLPKFNKEAMRNAPKISWKGSRCVGLPKDTHVPSESCYHFELFSLVNSWVRDSFAGEVFVEANAPNLQGLGDATTKKQSDSRKRCDLLLSLDDGKHRTAIELMASDSSKSIEQHIAQCREYTIALSAKQAVLINFFVSNTPAEIVKHKDSVIDVVHVQHDLEWTMARLYYRDNIYEIDLAEKNA